jgi:hypothetical protein
VYQRQFLLFLLLPVLAVAIARSASGADASGDSSAVSSGQGDSTNITVTGKLARNSARQSDQDPYILLDRGGTIQSYVRAASNDSLDRYLGRSVRIEGYADASPEGGIPHVTAEILAVGVNRISFGSARTRPAANEPAVQGVSFNATISDAQDVRPAAPERAPHSNPETSAPASAGRLTPHPVHGPHDGAETVESPTCGADGDSCDQCCEPCDGVCCFPRWRPGGVWVRADYLYWWTQGMNTPALVTTGPSTTQPGYFGAPGTTVLFGDRAINNEGRSGGRLQAGLWLNCSQTFGIEGEYLALDNEGDHFRQWSSGDPILSRPFFDVTRPANDPQNVEKVAFPRGNTGSVDGSVSVDSLTRFQSAGARLRFCVGCRDCCWANPCCPDQGVPGGFRTDFLVGYRFLRLDDRLGVREELTETVPTSLGAFLVQDEFDSENQFHGGELGLSFAVHRGRWSLEFIPKIAMGVTNEIVDINGSTRTTAANGTNTTAQGGLLALSSNIGHYTSNQFAVVPELGLNLGYQLTSHVQLTFGYSFIYWSRVARAGSQIDYQVNPDLLPNSTTTPNPALLHPAFSFQETGFWAQGLNFGVACSW